MKKLFISIIALCVFNGAEVFGQAISITPTGDEILVTKYGSGTPNLAGRQSSGSSATPTASTSGLGLASFSGRGHNGTSFTGDRVSIQMFADEAFSTTAQGTRITFSTTLNGTTFQMERMRIDNTGFIGIGTTNPLRRLHVSEGVSGVSSNGSAVAFFEDNTNNYLQLASPEANENGVLFGKPSSGASGGIIYNSANAMNLRTGGNNTRMTITSTGNVGIGTTTPTAKLDIEGDIVVKKTTITTTGTINALNRSGSSSIYFSFSGTANLNGIAGGVDGMILYIFTAAAVTLNISNENIGASVGNRIATNTSGTVTISGRGGATLIYDGDTSLWRIIGVAL